MNEVGQNMWMKTPKYSKLSNIQKIKKQNHLLLIDELKVVAKLLIIGQQIVSFKPNYLFFNYSFMYKNPLPK